MRIDWNCSEFHRISVEFELIVVKSYHMINTLNKFINFSKDGENTRNRRNWN